MISQFSYVLCNTIMTNSEKQNTLFCAFPKFNANSSESSLKHKKEHNSDIKRDKLVEYQQIVCWMSGKHYSALVNAFCPILSHKI